MPRTLKTGVKFGTAFAQRRDGASDLSFPLADIGVDLLLMGKVEGNSPVHLFQCERTEVLANGLRRVSGIEGIDDGIQGDTRAGDVESAVALFSVFAVLHAFSIEFRDQEVSVASAELGFRIG